MLYNEIKALNEQLGKSVSSIKMLEEQNKLL